MRNLLRKAIVLVALCAAAGSARVQAAPATGAVAYRFLDESASGAYDLSTTVRAQGPGEARLCFGYRGPGDHYYVRVAGRTVSLVRVQGGRPRELAPPYRLGTAVSAQPATLVVKRRPHKVSAIFRGTLVAVAADLDSGQGKVGAGCTGRLQIEPPQLQPVEPAAFSDDFMRGPGDSGSWEVVLGSWSTATVGDVTKSANGFSLRGAGSPALYSAGFPFWDDYIFQASFKCGLPEGTVGLAAYYQDPRNYLGVVWSAADGLRLVRVRNGDVLTLARKAAAWIPNQWYRLAIQACDGHLTALVDGKVCLEARDGAFGRGRVALYVNGREAYFDDVTVKPAVYWHEPSPAHRSTRWVASGGQQVGGDPAWEDYELRATLRPSGREDISLAFGWRDPRNYYLFCWGPGSSARRQIVRVAAGQRKVLAEAPGGFRPGQTYPVQVALRRGYASVKVSGRTVLEASDAGMLRGAVGVGAMSDAVRDVAVLLREEPPPPEEEITKEFTNSSAHPDMAEWANPARAWMPRPATNGPVFWRKGDFFGDAVIRMTFPPAPPSARLAIALAADGQDPGTGYLVVVQRPDPKKVAVQLMRQTTTVPVASGAVEVTAGQPVPLTVARHGSFLMAEVEGKCVVRYRDVAPLSGTRIGVQVRDVNLDLKEVQIRSPHVYDYTFHDAPTDWHAQTGIWEITNRWSCSPGWSWFGGRSERLAAIWNKRRFSGDLTLEYYAAPKMDAVPEAYAARFRDMNATICADGYRLNSGYSFIIGGWRNTKTAILRGDRVVAETTSFRLPSQSVGHRQWFYVRIEKRGSRVSLAVDNTPLLSYDDTDPLPGDRVALWTQNNGMMVSRAVISYQHEKEMPLYVRAPGVPGSQTAVAQAQKPPSPPSVPLLNDFEQDPEQWRGLSARLSVDARTASHGRKSLLVTNAEPGGEFRVQAVPGPVDLTQAGYISFDYKVPPGVRVNVYLRVDQVQYAIGFTGQGLANPAAGVLASLGRFEDVRADGAWHHASFDALSALRRHYPTRNPLTVEEITFANWDPSDEYTLAGVTANGIGARYHIDRFALGRTGAVVAGTGRPARAASVRVALASSVALSSGRPIAGPASSAPAGAAGAPPTPRRATRPVRVARMEISASVSRSLPSPTSPPRPLGSPRARGSPVLLLDTFSPRKSAIRWESAAGRWEITRDGRFAPLEKPEFAYAFAGDPGWTDYVLRADLINGQDAGLCVRAQDWNNCVFLVIRPAHKDLWWFVRRDGQWGGVLAPGPLTVGPKPVMQVKVTAIGDTFTCYIDGKQVSQIKDSTFARGRIGVYIHPAEAGQAWDNVQVTAVPNTSSLRAAVP